MRQIEYRGYDNIAQSWCIGSPVKDKDVKGRYWIMFNENEGVIIDKPETIGQYTGQKDKNGIEIYEGDIIQDIDSNRYEVIFYYGQFKAAAFPRKIRLYNISAPLTPPLFEIIGNVHENPDLL